MDFSSYANTTKSAAIRYPSILIGSQEHPLGYL